MAKKVEEQVLDRKTKEQIRQELLEVINTKVKDELVETVAKDVRESFDDDYKEGIKTEIHEELVVDIKASLQKEQAKLSRKKSFKIFRLYIYMLILIAAICYLIYLLYNSGGLDLFKDYEIVKKGETTTTTTTTTTQTKDLNYYLDNYSYLMNRVIISNYEILKGSYDVMSLSVPDRLAIAYHNLSNDKIKIEGMIYTITDLDLSESYKEIFGSTDGYKAINFIVDNISYAYQDSTATYIAIPLETTVDKVENDIINITENGDTLVFTCKVGIIRNDNDIYNVNNLNELVGTKKDNFDLSSYGDKLSTVEYTFKRIDNNYYLSNIDAK